MENQIEMLSMELVVRQSVDDPGHLPKMELRVIARADITEALGGSENVMRLAGVFLRSAADQYDNVKTTYIEGSR